MARAKAPCGTYAAYRRHLREKSVVDDACREAQRVHDVGRSVSPVTRARRVRASGGGKAAVAPPPVPKTGEGHVSRLEVLQELLEESRRLVKKLSESDPTRAYLQMREQREIVREIADLQGNGQVKGVSLVDQLAEARARRESESEAAASS